jgi:hypothetical protein
VVSSRNDRSAPAGYPQPRPFAQPQDRDVIFLEELLDPLLARLALVRAVRIMVQVVRVELERQESQCR